MRDAKCPLRSHPQNHVRQNVSFVAFCLMLYVVRTMPTKKDLKYLLSPSEQGGRRRFQEVLNKLIDQPCTIVLTHVLLSAGGDFVTVTGTVRSVDEQYVLLEIEQKSDAPRIMALQLDMICSIEKTK